MSNVIKLPEVPEAVTKLMSVDDPSGVFYVRSEDDPAEWVSDTFFPSYYTLGELLGMHPEGFQMVEEEPLELAKRYFEEDSGRIDDLFTDMKGSRHAQVILEHVFDRGLLD